MIGENKLVRVDVNIPILILKKNKFYLEITPNEEFVMIRINFECVYLFYLQNDIENIKAASSELVQSFLVGDLLFHQGKNRFNIYKYSNKVELVLKDKYEIESILILSEISEREKNHFLLGVKEFDRYKLVLLSEEGKTEFEMVLNQNEELTHIKLLKQYSVEKYTVLIGYINRTD